MSQSSRICCAKSLKVERIGHLTAKAFFECYEHLGNCGLGVWHYGAFDNRELLGVVSFGTPCFAHNRGLLAEVARRFNLPIYQISRGGTAPLAAFNTPSRVLSEALTQFRKDRGNTLVAAYADPHFNEMGTIYQACNAIYTGRTNPKNQANYIIHGRQMTGWSVRKKFGTRSIKELRTIDPKVVKVPLRRKYRYIFVLASGLQKRLIVRSLRPMMFSYPKRHSEGVAMMDIAMLISKRDQWAETRTTSVKVLSPAVRGGRDALSI